MDTGKLCVSKLDILAVNTIVGKFNSNGVLGLAPGGYAVSVIQRLFATEKIDEMKVGINYEDPKDLDSISTISFGHYDYD